MPPRFSSFFLRLASPLAVAAFVATAAGLPPGVARDARAEAPPDVVLGPDTATAATRVEAPIAEVTVYSDRARVRRRGRLADGAGGRVRLVRLPDLPGAVDLESVRLAATGGRVLRVEAAPVERDRLSITEARKLLDDLDVANDRLAELDDRGAVDGWELSLLTQLRPAAPVPEDKREGRRALTVDLGAWTKALDFLGGRLSQVRGRLAALVDERRAATVTRDRLRADLEALDKGGFSRRSVEVSAVLEPGAAGAHAMTLELEYFVPGARWKPTYDLHWSQARGELAVDTAALVEQATGESWDGVALSFSTAIPGEGIELPELLTWTLGERGELVPRSRPAAAVPNTTLPPPPVRARSDDGLSVATLVRERLRDSFAPATPKAPVATVPGAAGDALRAVSGPMPALAEAPAPAPPPAAPVSPVFNATVTSKRLSRSDDDYEEEAAVEKAEAAPVSWRDIVVVPRKKRLGSSAPPTVVALALDDAGGAPSGPTFTDPDLPAVSGGGFDYVYPAPTAATVPSSAAAIRVPLSTRAFRTAAYYQATPALAATAYLRARVRNDGRQPWLRGPAAIFADGEYLGQGRIETTGPGGDIELPLGADEDIRLVRQVVPATRTTGLIMKSDETVYDVKIQIGNYKKQPVWIDIADQVPRSVRDKVEVKLVGADPAPRAAPDAGGVLRWWLQIPAGATRTIAFRYQIVRPKGWRLYQR